MTVDADKLREWRDALHLMLVKERDAAQNCINDGSQPLYWERVVDAMDNAIEWLNVNPVPLPEGGDDGR